MTSFSVRRCFITTYISIRVLVKNKGFNVLEVILESIFTNFLK